MRADGYFAVVPEWVIDHPEISDAGVRLYAVLRRYADKDSGESWPLVATLSERLGKGERQVKRLIRELEEAGAIMVRPRYEGGKQTSNLYTVLSHPPVTQMSLGGVTDVTQGGVINVTQNQSQKNQSHSGEGDRRDTLFEAVAEAWMGGYDPKQITKSERGRINAALTELRRIGATPEAVLARGRAWRKKWPDTPASPQGIVRNWNALAPPESRHEHLWVLEDTDEGFAYVCECGARSQPLGVD